MPRKDPKHVREGDEKQTTDKGLDIPIPKRSAFDSLLRKAAPSKRKASDESESDPSEPAP